MELTNTNKNITRAEMVTIISRVINFKDAKQGNVASFGDINNTLAKDSIQTAAAGIINGEGEGNFAPDKNATRAEAITVLLRSLELIPELAKVLDSLK